MILRILILLSLLLSLFLPTTTFNLPRRHPIRRPSSSILKSTKSRPQSRPTTPLNPSSILTTLLTPDPSNLPLAILDVQSTYDHTTSLLTQSLLSTLRYTLLTRLLHLSPPSYYKTTCYLIQSTTHNFDRTDAPNLQRFPPVPPLPSGDDSSKYEDYSPVERTVIIERRMEGSTKTITKDSDLNSRNDPMSLYDKFLLWIFRKSVEVETGMEGRWDVRGIEGLVEQGRGFMIDCYEKVGSEGGGDPGERQVVMVENVLKGLMGPIVPVYRLFMGGIVPRKLARWIRRDELCDAQVFDGGMFYAPYLTSLVTPLFFQFLVGPARTNRREDGRRGGVLVEKCRFLEKSNCKGLCLYQCKMPAERLFKEELGVELYVQPNFRTQECQWSWGEGTKDIKDDVDWPKGCLEGCIDRKKIEKAVE